ncbi:MAG: Branched-chain amino acid transport system permease protein LivM, partial [uncultured Thermomicrobiales bacterium]
APPPPDDAALRRRPQALPHPRGEGRPRAARAALPAAAVLPGQRLLAQRPGLRGHRRRRRDRPEPAHGLHGPGVPRARLLHRRGRVRDGTARRGARRPAARLAARRGDLRRPHRRRHRPVRPAPARQLPGHRHARPRVPRRAPVPQPAGGHGRQLGDVDHRPRDARADRLRRPVAARRELLAQPGLLLADLGDRRHRRAPGQEPRAHAARPGD